jgi:hypothetical protein
MPLPGHLTHIVAFLRDLIWYFTPPERVRETRAPMLLRLSNTLGRAERLFARLHALWSAGRLPAPRPARPRHPPAAPAADPTPDPRPAVPRLPRARGWLLRAGPAESTVAASRLQHWLERPDLPEFLAAVPRAGRYLRPLCRLLNVDPPPFLALPPRPRRPRPPRPRAPRPPSLRRPVLPPGDPPFRPYVLAAARAWKPRYG